MPIASRLLNGQGPGTRESPRLQDDNRFRPIDRCCRTLANHPREEISGEMAWCGPGALAALLATLATALLTLIVVRLWLKLEKAALSILQPVRTCTSLRRSAPGQSGSKGW